MDSFDTIAFYNQAAIPAANQFTPWIDTTYWNDTGPWASVATRPGPGKSRGQLAGRRITGSFLCTVQNATVRFELLTNPAATDASAFENDSTFDGLGGALVDGVLTAVAGTTYLISWLPMTPDWRITINSGGTPPTAIRTTANIVLSRVSGA